MNHGEAVILGITTALKFSRLNNYLSSNEFEIIIKHIESFGLPNNIKKYFFLKDVNKIISFMMNDKKNTSNKINLILLKKIGKPLMNINFDKKKNKNVFKQRAS